MPKAGKRPFPTKDEIAAFIRESPTPVGKREIARAFHISGADRVALKTMLKELQDDGTVERGRKRRVSVPGGLPEVTVVTIDGVDESYRRKMLLENPASYYGLDLDADITETPTA